jgi:hypothetical protein
MEIEEKIIQEINNLLQKKENLDSDKLSQINKLIVYQSVKAFDKEKTDRDAINYVENKLYDLFTTQ